MPKEKKPVALFWDTIKDLHQSAAARFQIIEDDCFAWFDEILEAARKTFKEDDSCLLPKTPSAKRTQTRGRKKKIDKPSPRRNIQIDLNEDEESTTNDSRSKGGRKRLQCEVSEDDDDDFIQVPNKKVILNEEPSEEEEVVPVRATRVTRASSRAAATTTKARNTRKNTKASKNKKIKSVDVIMNLETKINETPQFDMTEEVEKEKIGNNKMTSPAETRCNTEGSDKEENTPKRQTRSSLTSPKTSQNVVTNTLPKTPIQNFSTMNVKDKVQAYEAIVTHTPVQNSGRKSDNTRDMQTPAGKITNDGQKTPDTVVATRTVSAVEHETSFENYEEIVYEEIPAMPGVGPNGLPSAKKDTPRRSSTRKSVRASLRKSLKVLPSKQKMTDLHEPAQVEEKPVRTRTRLRLKKHDKEKECEEENTKPSSTDEEVIPAAIIVQDSESQENEPERRRTRQSVKQSIEKETTSTPTHVEPMESEEGSHDSDVGESVTSTDIEEPPRMTRSKMRQPKPSQEEETETRTTRTKTRKRQLEEETDTVASLPKRSRSIVNKEELSDQDKTPTRNMSGTDGSSEDEIRSPKCPANKVVRPHPMSFLNKLKSKPTTPLSAARINPGLVRSFIPGYTNSPAKKPTAKEIQERRKKELLEKERKRLEVQKKKEEEHKKRTEEIKKKRDERLRKAREAREEKDKRDRENRLNIVKKMEERTQLTLKSKEEKIKEEREKQKMRLQKFEEAEERRKQEEEERKKKLEEQRENEKFTASLMHRKKEFEEQERLKKIELEKQKAIERRMELEKEREREQAKLKAAEEEKQREWQKKKEERERLLAKEKAEREKIELEKKKERELQHKKEMEKLKEQERLRIAEEEIIKEQQRKQEQELKKMERLRIAEEERIKEQQRKQEQELKKMVDKHNAQVQNQQKPTLPKPILNRTHSIEDNNASRERNDSYEMTPDRVYKPTMGDNYNIDDIKSDDETDDDEAPRKQIPDWALGTQLKTALIKQHLHPPDLDQIFDPIEPPDLNKLFAKKRERFNKRTSSAHWDTPILKPGLLGRT